MGDPWLRLIYVPACCTPVAQPMDAGIIAILKGHLRKLYGKWVVQLTVNQLARGVRHAGRRVPSVVCSTSGWAYVWYPDTFNRLDTRVSQFWDTPPAPLFRPGRTTYY